MCRPTLRGDWHASPSSASPACAPRLVAVGCWHRTGAAAPRGRLGGVGSQARRVDLSSVKLLVLTSRPVTAADLREALPRDVDTAQTEVLVVAPALADSPIKFWLSDTDEATARATEVRTETVRDLSAEGLSAVGRTGVGDPAQAIADALVTFPADRILLFGHAQSDDQRYREDIDEEELRERFGLPVDRVGLSE